MNMMDNLKGNIEEVRMRLHELQRMERNGALLQQDRTELAKLRARLEL